MESNEDTNGHCEAIEKEIDQKFPEVPVKAITLVSRMEDPEAEAISNDFENKPEGLELICGNEDDNASLIVDRSPDQSIVGSTDQPNGHIILTPYNLPG